MGTIGNVKSPCSNSQWFYAHSLRKIKFWVSDNTKFKRGLTCQWVLLQHQSCLYLSFQTKASLRNCLKIDLTHSIFVCKNKQFRVPNLKILCFFFFITYHPHQVVQCTVKVDIDSFNFFIGHLNDIF